MPFEEDERDIEPNQKTGLKKVSSQRSIFDNTPRKPTQEELDRKVAAAQERASGYKQQAAELALQFKKIIEDKTLSQNKNVFTLEVEKEVLSKMIQLAVDINNDPAEQESMGSLTWVTFLFKIALSQRDRINNLEYALSLLEKKLEPAALSSLILKELKALDKDNKNG